MLFRYGLLFVAMFCCCGCDPIPAPKVKKKNAASTAKSGKLTKSKVEVVKQPGASRGAATTEQKRAAPSDSFKPIPDWAQKTNSKATKMSLACTADRKAILTLLKGVKDVTSAQSKRAQLEALVFKHNDKMQSLAVTTPDNTSLERWELSALANEVGQEIRSEFRRIQSDEPDAATELKVVIDCYLGRLTKSAWEENEREKKTSPGEP
jgi:hypothetical protein